MNGEEKSCHSENGCQLGTGFNLMRGVQENGKKRPKIFYVTVQSDSWCRHSVPKCCGAVIRDNFDEIS